MADRRKLQGEIDRCLKKVTEGVESFEDIWQKVHSAANANQKEKYEADLKREIKKLQRLRDHIKTWCSSSDIKDKRILVENRKLIETQMERFKIVERETKTKAYSKEGLGAAAKMDPHSKEKGDVTNWLSQTIENLNLQLEQFESRIEQLTTKKKKMDKDKQDIFEELKAQQDKHLFHIKQLETIMRMVDNDALPIEQIKKIKDDVEYYVDCNQDPDFEENDFIYDELDLEDLGAAVLASSPPNDDHYSDNISGTPTSTNSSSPSPSPSLSINHSKDNEENDRKIKKSINDEKNKSIPLISSPTSTNSTSSNTSSNHGNNNKVVTTPSKLFTGISLNDSTNSNHRQVTPPPLITNSTTIQPSMTEIKNLQNSLEHSGMLSTNSSLLTNSVSLNSTIPRASSPSLLINNISSVSPSVSFIGSSSASTFVTSNTNGSSVKPEVKMVMNGPLNAGGPLLKPQSLTWYKAARESLSCSESSSESMSSLKSIAQQAVVNAGLENQIPPPSSTETVSISTESRVLFNNSVITSIAPQVPPPTSPSPTDQPTQTTTIRLNPLLGVAPLGPVPLSREHFYQLTMLEAAYHHLPHPSDSERIRHYLPRHPFPTPTYYPQLPPPHADSVDYFFQRLSTETLFFIFYYMEGTKAQYLAAKALKKQSWRFHTKYMMWFQRHEEPKTITEDFEQGTYIYFDYEKWAQRKKEGFTFEYRYLEDRDLN
ncbi:CCR4-NOT transcription complex subunit 3-like isoform X1 [Mytilus californianus]|uniref:CCR4-NOT transcription complex subunit 3-like isoform X1 n=1 Tax=Mytilus californianus TaxID=6549 RepID=UPI00224533B4|nr:CCR4-NOT transcription complex subunit 3-like isoform X1 [Mytilus californianus]